MVWHRIVESDISNETIRIPDDSNGLLITKPCKLTNVNIIGGLTQVVIRAACDIDNMTNEDFGADGIIISSSNVSIKNSIGHLPVDRIPYEQLHPDWIQIVCIDENTKPITDGVIENITIDNCKLYAPHEPELNRRGVQGIVGFDCEVRNMQVSNCTIYTDVEEHGVSFIKPVGCKVNNCKIKSINSDKKVGIIFENRKGTGAGYGNIVKNNEAMVISTENTELIDNKLLKSEVVNMEVFNVANEYPQLRSLPKGIPRGYRNNNAGNIKDFDIGWQGLISANDALDIQKSEFSLQKGDKMCVFKHPSYGIRAIAKDLQSKQRKYRDCKSVRGIMERYAPAGKENPHQEQYIWFIANRIGVSDKETISVKHYKVMRKFIEAIILFENGTDIDIPYSDEIIDDGIASSGIDMMGEEDAGGVKKQIDSNGIRKGATVVGTTTAAAIGKVADDNGVFTPQEHIDATEAIVESTSSDSIDAVKDVIIENKDVLVDMITTSSQYSMYDWALLVMLGVIAFAALDWVLDRRLTNILGIK
ncbi:hypothetical protein N9043_00670 [bacterium]|nr:hypothetical protein [bacterium]